MKRQEITILPAKMVESIMQKMNYGGHNPTNQNIYMKVYSYISLLLLPCTWVLQIVFLFINNYEEFGDLIMDLVIIAAVWQIFTKSFIAHYKRTNILRLIDIIYKKFWDKDLLTEEEHLQSQAVYQYCLLTTKAYTVSICFSMFGHCLTAVLRGNHNLIMNIGLPTVLRAVMLTTPGYQLLLLLQFYLMACNTLTGLIQMDNLFVTSIALILAQLKMLKSKLLSFADNTHEPKFIIQCIDHHNLLFDAISEVENIFSGCILHLFATDVLLGVVTLLGLLVENKITQLIELNFILVSVFGQLYVYCLLGQLIQDETLSVADAAYNCKWEGTESGDVKRSVLMTIQRSQRPAKITMGGLLILRLENFTKISRLMLSILTLMINMKIEK